MSFHGGLSGVLVAMWLYGRSRGIKFFDLTDAIAPWSSGGIFFGRIGNFINGELWGKITSPDAPWAVMVNGEPRHPSQLYEAFLEGLVLSTVLWFYTRKPRPTAAASGLFLMLYGAFRIVIEFVRVPDEQLGYLSFGWVTMGQILSLPMVILGAVIFTLALRKGRDADDAPSEGTPHSTRAAMQKKAG
jgi:phosphatidylglycerol:prolipoprotein diacylglycerol transferase